MRDAFGVERVSKIAMQPVYHGTSPKGLKAIYRGKFKTMFDGEREGIHTTPNRRMAEFYSLKGNSHDNIYRRAPHKGRVAVWNAAGVKPKYKGTMVRDFQTTEAVYDPKELGKPLRTWVTSRKEDRAEIAARKAAKEDGYIEGAREWVRNNRPAVNADRHLPGKVLPERDPRYRYSKDTEVGQGLMRTEPDYGPDRYYPAGRQRGNSFTMLDTRRVAATPKTRERGGGKKRRYLP